MAITITKLNLNKLPEDMVFIILEIENRYFLKILKYKKLIYILIEY